MSEETGNVRKIAESKEWEVKVVLRPNRPDSLWLRVRKVLHKHLDTLTNRNDHGSSSASIIIEPCLREPRAYDLKNRLCDTS